jgi:sugar lactone lactonase YvrE
VVIERWRATPASAEAYELGEGPRWDAPRQRLLWVDIPAGAVHEGRLDGDRVVRTRSRTLDSFVGAVAVGPDGGLLVAGRESLIEVGPDGTVTPGPVILPAGAGRRLNDGACGPDGVFLVGSLALADPPGGSGAEVLVRVEADRSVTVLDDDLGLSNGLGWSPDGRLLYSIDSMPGVVHVRDSPDGPRRVLIAPGEIPDGMCVDAAGDLWIAFYGAAEVRRYTPAGELTGVVEVAAPHVTCVAFAGPALNRLLITTTGPLFLAEVGAVGLPANVWGGFQQEETCS